MANRFKKLQQRYKRNLPDTAAKVKTPDFPEYIYQGLFDFLGVNDSYAKTTIRHSDGTVRVYDFKLILSTEDIKLPLPIRVTFNADSETLWRTSFSVRVDGGDHDVTDTLDFEPPYTTTASERYADFYEKVYDMIGDVLEKLAKAKS